MRSKSYNCSLNGSNDLTKSLASSHRTEIVPSTVTQLSGGRTKRQRQKNSYVDILKERQNLKVTDVDLSSSLGHSQRSSKDTKSKLELSTDSLRKNFSYNNISNHSATLSASGNQCKTRRVFKDTEMKISDLNSNTPSTVKHMKKTNQSKSNENILVNSNGIPYNINTNRSIKRNENNNKTIDNNRTVDMKKGFDLNKVANASHSHSSSINQSQNLMKNKNTRSYTNINYNSNINDDINTNNRQMVHSHSTTYEINSNKERKSLNDITAEIIGVKQNKRYSFDEDEDKKREVIMMEKIKEEKRKTLSLKEPLTMSMKGWSMLCHRHH